MKRDINEIKTRARIYSKEKTLCYIKEIINGRENFYNGFISKIYDDMIIFFDIVMKREFPILFTAIEVIEPSKKDISIKTALEIWEENKSE